MKTTAILLPALISFAAATPTFVTVRSDLEVPTYDDSNGMKWTGMIDGQNYTLYGDAANIHNQILAIDPSYQKPNEARSVKRSRKTGSCGQFATGSDNDVYDGISHLQGIGGSCHVNGKSCIRLTCKDTSGIYLCNDKSNAIAPTCSYLAKYAEDIYAVCGFGLKDAPMSGQEFDTDGYNVIVAYANCGHSASEKPSSYKKPGPNGKSARTCTNCVKPGCGQGKCPN